MRITITSELTACEEELYFETVFRKIRKDFDTAQEQYRQTAQMAVTDDKDRLDMTLRKGKLDDSAVELDYTAQQLARVNVTASRAGVAVFAALLGFVDLLDRV